jgi:Raf kinase inhibitor-like YbhB/YbcL family protein
MTSDGPFSNLPDVPSFELASRSFEDGGVLPPPQRSGRLHAGGADASPQLSWSGAPAETGSFAVTVFDPDAPGAGGYWHWAVINIPGDVASLPEGAGAEAGPQLPQSAVQLQNDAGFRGYVGAAPPPGHGKHRYIMTVYALDVEQLDAGADARPGSLGAQFSQHLLGTATLTGIYSR